VYLAITTPSFPTFQIVGPPSSQIQKLPSLSTAIPSESIPHASFATVFAKKLAFETPQD
jgi:hypothetical protein